ncbi:MAG TPA: hypothetical protein VH025_08440 [Solirubrobacteraceae bacterium]|nr:hypothetical protein [Solirubrobacteraceae bacterium]
MSGISERALLIALACGALTQIALVSSAAGSAGLTFTPDAPPVVKVTLDDPAGSGVDLRILGASTGEGSSPACRPDGSGPISVHISSGAGAVAQTLSGRCKGDWHGDGRTGAGWEAPAVGGTARALVRFIPRFTRASVRTLRYTVSWDHRTLASGRIIVRTSVVPARRIFDGTNSFAGFCLARHLPLHHDGRLAFCIKPMRRLYGITLTRVLPASAR